MHSDPRIDAYIAKSAEFARPILAHLRAVVHKACPQVQETIKWGMPHFVQGRILCGMAAFKQHASFFIWGQEIPGDKTKSEGMGQFGKLTKVRDLPGEKTLITLLRKAAALREQEAEAPRAPRPDPMRKIEVPAFLAAALDKNPGAKATFNAFPYSHRREYIKWLTEARREETRQRRLATAITWISEGKPQNWKYAAPKKRKQ